MRIDVLYHVAATCRFAPQSPIGNYSLVPCGPAARLFVVFAPCPAGADANCVSPNLNRSACGGNLPDQPLGGCLPALQTAMRGRYSTPDFELHALPGKYMLATVFHSNASMNASEPPYWYGALEPAWRVASTADKTLTLTPTFDPWEKGRIVRLPQPTTLRLRVNRTATARLHHSVFVYLPPVCTESALPGWGPPPACSRAKMAVVLDGSWAASTNVVSLLVNSADGLTEQLRARPLALIFSTEDLAFADGTPWPCARFAMYTPRPPAGSEPWRHAIPECVEAVGQADTYLAHLANEVLPTVRTRFGLRADERAAIAGYSLGGLTACHAVWTLPGVFDAAACSSPSFWWPVNDFDGPRDYNRTSFAQLVARRQPPAHARLYVSVGTGEFLSMGGTRAQPGSIPLAVEAMREAGLHVPFEQLDGYEHDEERSWITSTLWRGLTTIAPPGEVVM